MTSSTGASPASGPGRLAYAVVLLLGAGCAVLPGSGPATGDALGLGQAALLK